MLFLKKITPRKLRGQIIRQCVLCGSEGSELNPSTNECIWYGKPYPESMLIKEKGKWYCFPHYRWRFRKQAIDEVRFDIKEEREGPIKGAT